MVYISTEYGKSSMHYEIYLYNVWRICQYSIRHISLSLYPVRDISLYIIRHIYFQYGTSTFASIQYGTSLYQVWDISISSMGHLPYIVWDIFPIQYMTSSLCTIWEFVYTVWDISLNNMGHITVQYGISL